MLFIITVLIVFFISNANTLKNCDDCITIDHCRPALERVLVDKSPETERLVRNAYCGYDKLPKICCSEFVLTPSKYNDSDDIENHPNVKLLSEDCGEIDGNRIVGGSAASLYEFPWIVLISYKYGQSLKFECAGTLINSKYVLTAAHCVQNRTIAGVRVGEYDISSRVDCVGEGETRVCETRHQDRYVAEIITHNEYKAAPKVMNDIALLRLSRPVNLTYKNSGTICLPVMKSLREMNLDGERATVAGWGFTENYQRSNVLLKVELPVYSPKTCKAYYNRNQRSDNTDGLKHKLCAGEIGRDSCRGDSGGPLMLEGHYNESDRYIQFGIVSYGPSQCGSNTPGIYTDVRMFMKWILDTIKP
ncbi:unnamed protein product [Parnassius apollo]|uniref:(apollo) hypothetical protein n=1 Tax=Parnassius apollo TaxID=110799 RepID=A0A8S3VZG2_PARAO|nr:unnamed protein product [Parnassius apollo]